MRLTAIVAMVILGVVATTSLSSDKPEPSWSKMDEAQKSEHLLDRIRKLEARVAELEQRPAVAPGIRPPSERSVPRNWQRRYFNGVEYYIVPCAEGPAVLSPS